jgi:hypothetical protein
MVGPEYRLIRFLIMLDRVEVAGGAEVLAQQQHPLELLEVTVVWLLHQALVERLCITQVVGEAVLEELQQPLAG